MQLAVELMMGVSLAACAGLRAWMPLLMVGLLTRAGYLDLNPHFAFLGRTDALIVFGVATLLELLGDKFIAVDHVLDALGTVVRPAAATVLASAMMTKMDPMAATILGLIVGGGTALTMHGAKAALRAKVTALALIHGGTGNAALSLGEDVVAGVGVWTAAHAPILAFAIALAAIAGAVWLIVSAMRHGRILLAQGAQHGRHFIAYGKESGRRLRFRLQKPPTPDALPPQESENRTGAPIG